MGGNHDWWGGDFLTGEIGVEFLQKPTVLELEGRKVLLAHGDGLGAGDLGYRVLKKVLRGSWTRFGFRWLHPDIGARIARRVSKTGTDRVRPESEQVARARFLETWANERLTESPALDLVVLGHTHTPMLKEPLPGRYYLNLGDWLDRQTYGVLAAGEPPRLLDWQDDRGLSESDG